MMATLLSLAGYLVHMLCLVPLSISVLEVLTPAIAPLIPSYIALWVGLPLLGMGTVFRSVRGNGDVIRFIVFSIAFVIVFALKNFQWAVLISEFHHTLPFGVFQVIAILLCLGHLVCVTIGAVVIYICECICCVELWTRGEQFPNWLIGILWVVSLVVMDMILSYSDMMDTVLSCLVLVIALALLLNMIWGSPFQQPTASIGDPVRKSALVGYLMAVSYKLFDRVLLLRTFVISLAFVLLDMFVKASSVSDIITTLVGLSGMIATTLVALFFVVALLRIWMAFQSVRGNGDVIGFIVFSIPFVIVLALKKFQWAVLICESHYTLPSCVSQVIAILLCLGYLVCVTIGAVVICIGQCIVCCPVVWARDEPLPNFPNWLLRIMWVVSLVVMDMLLNYSDYLVRMVALSWLVLVIAIAAIDKTKVWWPEVIHTSIVALALLLLNMIWGSPFPQPVASIGDPVRKSALVGYLIYIVSSMAVSYNLFHLVLLLRTFVISLTFVLLDMFVKPSSVSDIITTLVGLSGMIATTLMALFFVVALSFVVFMFLDTWADILFPSITRNYPRGAFLSIAGLSFIVMQTMLGMPVEEPSIFSDMKVRLLGITDMINKYHGAYVVIKSLTVLVIPLISRDSRPMMYTTAAFIIAISLLPPGPGTPMEYPASTLVTDDFVQQTITTFVTSQINGADAGIELLADS